MQGAKKPARIILTMIKTHYINNLEFANRQQKLTGDFPVSVLERLLETLKLTNKKAQLTPIRYELTGHLEQFRQPSLHLRIETKLPLICQRCLEEMRTDFDLSFDYLVAHAATDAVDENDVVDWLEVSSAMNLHELIEDELLLAVPFAPMHEADCGKLTMQSGEKPNPFAVLKGKIKQ